DEAGLDVGATTDAFGEITGSVSSAPEQGNAMPCDLICFPSENALECRVAALDGLISTEQGDADRRGIKNRLQLGGCAAQLRRSFGHLRFQLAADLTKILLRQCALECGRGVVRSHREEQQVDLGGKIAAIARRSYQTALRIDADGNHEAAAWLPAAGVGNDPPARQPAD